MGGGRIDPTRISPLITAKPEVADAMKGATISTFGGNPMAATAGKAVLDYIEEQNLRVNAAEVGAYLRNKLLELQDKHALIGEVRGMGLMQGVELVDRWLDGTPEKVFRS